METNAKDIYNIVFKEYPDVLNTNDVSEILGVSPKMVYRILNNGSLISLKVGRVFRIPKINLLKYIKVFGSTIYEQPTT